MRTHFKSFVATSPEALAELLNSWQQSIENTNIGVSIHSINQMVVYDVSSGYPTINGDQVSIDPQYAENGNLRFATIVTYTHYEPVTAPEDTVK